MPFNTLPNLLSAEQATVNGWVSAWRAHGASAIGVTLDEVPQVLWSNHTKTMPALRAPIVYGAMTVGEVWIAGVNAAEAQAQLCADAAWLSALLRREVEMEDLTQELIETQDQLLALYELNGSLRRHNTSQDALADVAAQTARMMKSTHAFALLIKPRAAPMVVQYPPAFGPAHQMHEYALQADSTGNPVVLQAGDMQWLNSSARNALIVSTRLQSGELVALGWCNRSISEFGSPEIKLAQALVEQTGGHVESILRHEAILSQVRINAELELARTIQERLLPKQSLQLPQLDIAATTISAFEMGGDFYDYVHFPERPLMFCVGDVSGKGLSAASVMSAARAAIRTHSRYMYEPSPANVLNRANEDLESDLNSAGKFITAFVGHYAPETARLTYANAGHSPVLLKRHGEPARMLEADAPPLGVWSLLDCHDSHIETQEGDILVIASDGLPEATNAAGDMFGYARLTEAINELSGQPSAKIVEQLLRQVREFADGMPQADDQTLLVVKRNA